jgi:rod shape-determining protein MreD
VNGPRAKVPLVLLMVLVVHTSLLSSLRIAGVAPDAMLLLAVAAGIAGGPTNGAIIGFAGGIGLDCFLQTPLGLSALAFCLVGYAVGSVQSGILRATWWIPLATAFVASIAGEALYAMSGAVIGETHMALSRLTTVVLVVGSLNAAMAPFALRLMNWSLRPEYDTRYS